MYQLSGAKKNEVCHIPISNRSVEMTEVTEQCHDPYECATK